MGQVSRWPSSGERRRPSPERHRKHSCTASGRSPGSATSSRSHEEGAPVSDALEGSHDPRKLRVRVGLAFVRILRPALYLLLVASALFTFWAGGGIGGRKLPHGAAAAAPVLFGVFLLVFAVYRLALVRAKKYPAAMGLFQIGLGAL